MKTRNGFTRLLSRKKRKDIQRRRLLELFPKNSAGVEVGVWKGDFSVRILDVVSPRILHLVDPWLFQPEFGERRYGGKEAHSQADMDAIFANVEERLRFSPVEFHRAASKDAVGDFEDESLDWAYIDGNHEYEFVRDDLRNYAAKIRPGGLLAGDDLMWGQDRGRPVKRAVHEFLALGGATPLCVGGSQFLLRMHMH